MTPDEHRVQQMERSKRIQRAYQDLFSSPQAKDVLADLARFCREDQCTFVVDDPHGRISALQEGRREVILRIRKMMALNTEDNHA